MENQIAVSSMTKEPELHLLIPENLNPPLWQSLFTNVREALFPKKLPPLQLTSRPVKVADMWGEYSFRKSSAGVSLAVHAAALAGIIWLSIAGVKVVTQANAAGHSGGAAGQRLHADLAKAA